VACLLVSQLAHLVVGELLLQHFDALLVADELVALGDLLLDGRFLGQRGRVLVGRTQTSRLFFRLLGLSLVLVGRHVDDGGGDDQAGGAKFDVEPVNSSQIRLIRFFHSSLEI